uniref:Elongation of very long chain fatty acids protein n=1 Tax=Ditylenchus dipsaci TaxID=166011 RepID=A0A915E0D0_9BILA
MAQYDYWPRYGMDNYSYVMPIEKTFDSIGSTTWMQHYWHHSISLSLIYILLIYAGQKFMDSRKALALDGALFWWNLGLALFSMMGMVRMAPEMWWSINSNSLTYSICTASFAQGVTGFWTENFAMSKVFELADTAFIVARKRPLIFLHWYHHVTVLVYTWHAYKDHTASGRWFIFMNYTVHAFMYSYYALRALRMRLPKYVAMFITGYVANNQMVFGVAIGISIYRIKAAGGQCQQTWSNLYFSFTIYFTYFLLFCNFFYHAYLKRNNKYVGVTNNLTKSANGLISNGSLKHPAALTNGSLSSNGHLPAANEYKQKANRDMLFPSSDESDNASGFSKLRRASAVAANAALTARQRKRDQKM